jgi:hypothetical protein
MAEVVQAHVDEQRERLKGRERERRASWTAEACDDWNARFGEWDEEKQQMVGSPPGGRIGKALKPLVSLHGWEIVRPRWRYYLSQSEAKFASPERFAATFGDWSMLHGLGAPELSMSDADVQRASRRIEIRRRLAESGRMPTRGDGESWDEHRRRVDALVDAEEAACR